MEPMEAENLLKKLDRRLQNVEQILPTIDRRLQNVEEILPAFDRRLGNVEQILPTLATKQEMRAAIDEAVRPLATREEMHAAIAAEGERTRQRFDGVAESLRDDIRLIAESHSALQSHVREMDGRFDRLEKSDAAILARLDLQGKRLERMWASHEKRITRLEASNGRKGGQKRR